MSALSYIKNIMMKEIVEVKNSINIDRLIKSKKNTIDILTNGGQYNGDKYIPGTQYTGYVAVNGRGLYRQEVIPEVIYIGSKGYKTADGHGCTDITNRDSYKKLFQEPVFLSAKRFPFDISMDYKGGDKLSLFVFKNEQDEIEVNAYLTQYIRPFAKCSRVFLGGSLDLGRRVLYALDDNSKILAIVTPWPLRTDSPLQSFITVIAKSWFDQGDIALIGFENDLQEAMQRSKQFYDERNKARIEASERTRNQQRLEREIDEAMRIDNIVKSMSIPESEVSGLDLILVARSLNVALHPRTVGSIRKRVQKITIGEHGGFVMFFYRTKNGAGICSGVSKSIGQIIYTARERELSATHDNLVG